jgi:hypothetical protein
MPRAEAAPVSTTVRSAGKGVVEVIAGIPLSGSLGGS